MVPASLFHVQPSSPVPIYRQIVDQVLALQASGRIAAGTFLPSVRKVAEGLQINPMTVSKAYSLLERDGVVELVRGQGMCMAARQAPASLRARCDELESLLSQVAARAFQLDLTVEQVIEQLKKRMKDRT